jgi:hypothetical protein
MMGDYLSLAKYSHCRAIRHTSHEYASISPNDFRQTESRRRQQTSAQPLRSLSLLLLPDPPYFEAWDNKALLEQPTIAPMINANCAQCHRQKALAHLVVSVPPTSHSGIAVCMIVVNQHKLSAGRLSSIKSRCINIYSWFHGDLIKEGSERHERCSRSCAHHPEVRGDGCPILCSKEGRSEGLVRERAQDCRSRGVDCRQHSEK